MPPPGTGTPHTTMLPNGSREMFPEPFFCFDFSGPFSTIAPKSCFQSGSGKARNEMTNSSTCGGFAGQREVCLSFSENIGPNPYYLFLCVGVYLIGEAVFSVWHSHSLHNREISISPYRDWHASVVDETLLGPSRAYRSYLKSVVLQRNTLVANLILCVRTIIGLVIRLRNGTTASGTRAVFGSSTESFGYDQPSSSSPWNWEKGDS